MAVPAMAALQHRVPGERFRSLEGPVGSRVRIAAVPVSEEAPRDFILEPFDVLAPDAVVQVKREDGTMERLQPTPMRQFRGHIEGEPESLIYLSVGAKIEGLVLVRDRKFTVQSRLRPRGERRDRDASEVDVYIEEVPVQEEMAAGRGSFECGVEGQLTPETMPLPASLAVGGNVTAHAYTWPTATAVTMLNLAIDADSAMYANFGNNAATVETYVRNLVGAASVIYHRDLRTDLRISLLQVWTSGAGADPFAVNPGFSTGTWNGIPGTSHTTGHAMAEYGDWFHANRAAVRRSAAVLLSGQTQHAGVSWVAQTCSGGGTYGGVHAIYTGHRFGSYAYCGGVGTEGTSVPNPDANPNYVAPSSNYWSLLQFAHELGHNVESDHTHCISVSAALWGRPFVDMCNGQCGAAPLVVPAEKGTVMSYCHLAGGNQTRFTFGKVGEASEIVLTNMRGRLDSVTPTGFSAITAPASLAAGANGAASVTNTAGLTYDWTIVNGTFTGGATTATGASVNFTANTNPVTLRVVATNATGCGISDTKSVTVTAGCVAATVSSHPASASITAGNSTTLSVIGAGTAPLSYQWYLGASGNTASPIGGATSASLQVSPGATTSYWVRVSNSCGNANSNTATVTVCNPPAIATQPSSQTIASGGTANLSVGATGSATLTYQWYTGTSGNTNSPVANATSSTFSPKPSQTTSYWVRVTNGCGSANSNTATVTVLTEKRKWQQAGDHDGDGQSDVYWHNPVPRQNAIWFMDGATRTNIVIPNTDGGWEPLGTGDFNGDGKDDIIHHHQDGSTAYWLLNGGTVYGRAYLPHMARPTWSFEGIGDFNADGRDDVFWRNTTTGETRVWQMNIGGSPILTVLASRLSDLNWQVRAFGDFNGDGRDDIFFRQPNTGELAVWFMNGATATPAGAGTVANLAIDVDGAGDFDGDGKTDIRARNFTTGATEVWLMNGNVRTVVGSSSMSLDWKARSYGDFDGDGRTDIFWRHNVTGENTIWFMNGGAATSMATTTLADLVYQPAGSN